MKNKEFELYIKVRSNILLWYEEQNIMVLDCKKTALIENKMQDIINQHLENNTIWKGSDGRYYTYIGLGSRRKLKSAKSETKLYNVIANFYLENKLLYSHSSSFEVLFYEACNYAILKNHLKGNSVDRYENDYMRFFEDKELVKKDIRKITALDVADFLDDVLNENDITEKCFCNVKSLLLFVFSYAKMRRRFECLELSATLHDLKFSNRRFKQNIKRDNTQVFNVKETPELLLYIEQNYRDLRDLGLLLIAHTGMRPGELAELEDSLVEESIIKIRWQESKEKRNGKTTYFRDTPKQGHIRDIILSDEAKRIVEWIRCIKKEKGLNSPYLLCDDKGNKYHAFAFNSGMRTWCGRLGILRRSPNKLRKTYGTAMVQADCDINFVREQMGHCDIQTTYRSYCFNRQVEETSKKEADKVSLLLKKEI